MLSTKTKKAHIQLVNHIKIRLRPVKNAGYEISPSSSFFLNKGRDSLSAPRPKRSTNTQLNAFRLTAIVSFAILRTEEIGAQIEKKNAI
ncbi:hypothetical protein IJU97_04340 [bacterium]|nr:hypothetical protein [bacterium]